MDEQRLNQLLRELPRHQASPRFTAAVLRRLADDAPRSRPLRRLTPAAAAAALVAAGLVFGVHEWTRGAERQRELARLEALESEKRALEAEILELRRLARDARPVVYLGSTATVDLVVDLERLAERRSRWRESGNENPRPAAYAVPAGQPMGEPRR
jgi:hypothetical protein